MLSLQKSKLVCSNYIGLVLLIALQLLLCLYFGTVKSGFHEDEIATFRLSNSPDGLWGTWGDNQWCSGDDYKNSFLINQDTRFAYTMVYYNQENDVHPPFYYFIIHTISSIFPTLSMKWVGLIPNILFSLLTTVVVWAVSMKLIPSRALALITAGFYAFSVGTLSTVVFIRMYAMLAFFCALLVLIHVHLTCRLASGGTISPKGYGLLLVCTAMGILTQYYFLVFCFFLCGFFALGLLAAKKWKMLMLYVCTEFGAIALSIMLFPSLIYHCFDGYRGQEAWAKLESSGDAADALKNVVSIVGKQVCNGWNTIGILLLGLVLLLLVKGLRQGASSGGRKGFFVSACRKIRNSPFPSLFYLAVIGVIAGYFLIISRIAPFQADRYYMCLYPLIYILAAHTLFFLLQHLCRRKLAVGVLSVLLLLTCMEGHLHQNVNYLYSNYKQRACLQEYTDLPVIVLNGTYSWYADYWMYEYMNHPYVFKTSQYCDLSVLSQAAQGCDLSHGFLVYSCRMDKSQEELFTQFEQYIPLDSFEQIVWEGDPVYLCQIEQS